WYMPVLRLCLCVIDAIRLRVVSERIAREQHDVVIFDRYLYDQMANLNLNNPSVRATVLFLFKFVRPPDVAYLIDADPLLARSRKPEYPIAFLQRNRQS